MVSCNTAKILMMGGLKKLLPSLPNLQAPWYKQHKQPERREVARASVQSTWALAALLCLNHGELVHRKCIVSCKMPHFPISLTMCVLSPVLARLPQREQPN